MKNILSEIKKLCSPAFIYLMLSVFSILVIGFQNMGNSKVYCVGDYECDVNNTWLIFGFKIVYVIFWTFLLNLLCRSGFTQLAWFLVLLPFLLLFVLIGLLIFNNNPRQRKNKN